MHLPEWWLSEPLLIPVDNQQLISLDKRTFCKAHFTQERQAMRRNADREFIHRALSSCPKSHSISNFRMETTETNVPSMWLELDLGMSYLIGAQTVLHCFSWVFSSKLVQEFLLNEEMLSLSPRFLVPLEAAVNAEAVWALESYVGLVQILGWSATSCLTLGNWLNICELFSLETLKYSLFLLIEFCKNEAFDQCWIPFLGK